MTQEEAPRQVSMCLRCSRRLRSAKSVQIGMGPVCVKKTEADRIAKENQEQPERRNTD